MGQLRKHGLRHPALAGFALLLVGILQLEQLLHSLVVEHHICPVHGDLLHAEPHDEVGATEAPGRAVLATAPELDAGHDRCLDMTAPGARIQLLALPFRGRVTEREGPLVPALRSPLRRVLDNAPKTSPPA